MYVQAELVVNAPMLEGSLLHQRADEPGTETDERGRTVRRRVWVWSERLQIAGFADFVESSAAQLIPVEFKHGRKGYWDNDQIQLCAQALCLEEMTGTPVQRGEIFYWRSRRRVVVDFDESLRRLTMATIADAFILIAAGNIPLPITEYAKCKHCSLEPICLPREVQQLRKTRTK